jgi:hypothetical protein
LWDKTSGRHIADAQAALFVVAFSRSAMLMAVNQPSGPRANLRGIAGLFLEAEDRLTG